MVIGRGFKLCAGKSRMKRALEEGEAEGKAKRAGGSMNSDADEFFSLLERIEATEKQFGALRRINKHKPLRPATNMEAVAPKPLWRPSFEWEDFCSNEIGTCDIDTSSAFKAREGNSKQGNQLRNGNNHDKCVKQRSVCPDRNDTNSEGTTERLDLNLPSTSAELQLFH